MAKNKMPLSPEQAEIKAMKKEKSKESIDKRVFEPIMGEED